MTEAIPTFRSPVPPTANGAVASLRLEDLSAAGKLLVDAGCTGVASSVALGFATRDGDVAIFSVAPGEWFVLASALDVPYEIPEGASSVDVSHARVLFRLTGEDASRTLEKACALDFNDRFMPDGSAARTSVAKTACEVLRLDRDGMPSYLIAVGASYGRYLFDVLLDAADEFGGAAAAWDDGEI